MNLIFDWSNYMHLTLVERELLCSCFSTDSTCELYIGNDKIMLEECLNVAKKYNLDHRIYGAGRSTVKTTFNFVFLFPERKNSDNLIQNIYFGNLLKYRQLLVKNTEYAKEFLNTKIYKKIKHLNHGEEIIVGSFDVSDVYFLSLYGDRYDYSYEIKNSNLTIKKVYDEPSGRSTYDTNNNGYKIVKTINLIQRQICYDDLVTCDKKYEFNLDYLIDSEIRDSFLTFFQKELLKHNKKYIIIEKEESCYMDDYERTVKYVKIIDI